jgi:hypothetical protein
LLPLRIVQVVGLVSAGLSSGEARCDDAVLSHDRDVERQVAAAKLQHPRVLLTLLYLLTISTMSSHLVDNINHNFAERAGRRVSELFERIMFSCKAAS